MKIALCIGNLAERGRRAPKAYLIGYNHIKEQILDKYKNNIDVFLHSYEPELKEILIDLYNPINYVFEKQVDFTEEWKNFNPIYCETTKYQDVFSMTYSRYRVNSLKFEYEQKNNFIYDWVIFVRYDISVGYLEKIFFDVSLDSNYIYTAMWDQLNAGLVDQWFYSNSNNMNIVLLLYKYLTEYLIDGSDFIKATRNWINSNNSSRITNEILKSKHLQSLDGEKSVPIGRTLNNHFLYKWHFYVNNLWSIDKLKFVVTRDNYQYIFKDEPHNNIIRKF